jgi:hypothetical protein
MARRDAKAIDGECEALIAFAEVFLGQLHKYGRSEKAYYEKKAKTLREYRPTTASIRLRGIKMGIRDLLEMTDDLPTSAVVEIDAYLAMKGLRTLSSARKGL